MMKYIILILSVFFSVAGFGQGQMFLRATPAGGGPANLLLDDYPGATAAYAVMKLDNDYAGSCIRIRRDSDNTEQDIGFSGNDIDEASINSFCSGANCFVKTWYDQSGNGNNATQTTAIEQAKIHDSSTGIIYHNSILALDFGILNNSYSIPGIAGSARVDYFFVKQTTDNSYILFSNGSGGTNYSWVAQDGSTSSTLHSVFGSPTMYVNGSLQSFSNRDNIHDALTGYKLESTVNANVSAWTNFYLSFYSLRLAAKVQLCVLYTSDQSANRSAIETIINNYFSIY